MSKNMTQLLARLAALTERAESAEAELLAVREDNHSMMLEIDGLRTERDRLAQQKPVATLILSNYGSDFEMFYDLKDLKFDGMKMRLYAAPVPAPAVPAAIVTTPFIPDDDTRRNDEAFAAQQAATAPSVPKKHEIEGQLSLAESEMINAKAWSAGNEAKRHIGFAMTAIGCARDLLQSADHSERNLEKVAPDCRTCANRGRINGLSQESYCDSCIYQGRDWRENHFVDAAKRRCEACAILPCSCK